ncbi:MAG: HK97 gp10 family phage protein [Clostridia bacterium]|nr:HK97 gp10 family phage protein [Clostridia bacterium]
MVRVSVDASQLNAALDQIRRQMPEKLGKAIKDACLDIEGRAVDYCPIDDGLLSGSITSDVRTDGGFVYGRVGTNIEYAPYVHEGTGIYARGGNGRQDVPWAYKDESTGELIWTKGNKPQPFLEQAVNEATPGLLEHFRNILEGG